MRSTQTYRAAIPAMKNKPNVLIILTDDQGWGDLGCHGNPWLQTPHLDRLHDESVRLTDFHMQPLCTPSRGALMTGRSPLRNGAWATCWGRSILGAGERTMAEVFTAGGWRTGLFGKWHLGDNYPYRPFDRGFTHVVAHKGGGVGQTPDFWGNRYFDDTYFHNGQPRPHAGYCTDIWFDEARCWIDEGGDEPFLAIISTNAPHTPHLVEEHWAAPYRNDPRIPIPEFCGMIANIDHNVGLLREFLAQRGLAENTLVIFSTDNGGKGGWIDGRGYNGGMRGTKSSFYEGGHRVPCFLHHPAGDLVGGRDLPGLTCVMDLLPTLAGWCGLTLPDDRPYDGIDLSQALQGTESVPAGRCITLQYRQATNPPEQFENCIASDSWRLVQGRELYDVASDPGQEHDLADAYPEVVAQLRAGHTRLWSEVAPDLAAYHPITLGSDAENPARLDAMDVLGDVAWHQTHIIAAQRSTGTWCVRFDRPGRYRFRLRRWPEESGLGLTDAAPAPHIEQAFKDMNAARRGLTAQHLPICGASLTVAGTHQEAEVQVAAACAVFDCTIIDCTPGRLEAWFHLANGERCGAYYVNVERLVDAEPGRGSSPEAQP